MKILMISDREERYLWDDWNEATAQSLADVGLVLSAGDLDRSYLEFLVTMLNVPFVYVPGNHDFTYEGEPPEGCENADGRLLEVGCVRGSEKQTLRILGLGGSMAYKKEPGFMYTENEMRARIRKAEREIKKSRMLDILKGSYEEGRPAFDILLTHAPCRGFGDMSDLPHTGFDCFNELLNKYSPRLHCYGHVHPEYGAARRHMIHSSGTMLINCSGHYIIDFVKP